MRRSLCRHRSHRARSDEPRGGIGDLHRTPRADVAHRRRKHRSARCRRLLLTLLVTSAFLWAKRDLPELRPPARVDRRGPAMDRFLFAAIRFLCVASRRNARTDRANAAIRAIRQHPRRRGGRATRFRRATERGSRPALTTTKPHPPNGRPPVSTASSACSDPRQNWLRRRAGGGSVLKL